MNTDELVGLLCVVAAFAVWLTVAVHRALADAEWGEPENGRLDRLDRACECEDRDCLACCMDRHPAGGAR